MGSDHFFAEPWSNECFDAKITKIINFTDKIYWNQLQLIGNINRL